MKRLLSMALLLVTMISSMAVSASAADYTFDGVNNTDYYPSTSYEETYNARYNYGGTNLVDYQIPELPYGVLSTTQTGIMEKRVFTNLQQSIGGVVGNGIYPDCLCGAEIAPYVQVISLADAYDALRTPRSYRDAISDAQAVKMLLDEECGAFDPDLIDAFEPILGELWDLALHMAEDPNHRQVRSISA